MAIDAETHIRHYYRMPYAKDRRDWVRAAEEKNSRV